MISTSPHKEKEARERLGADNFIVSKNHEQMAVRSLRMDVAVSAVEPSFSGCGVCTTRNQGAQHATSRWCA